jgi:3-deoxy-D-manno-octulosonate 8-phosphate phosphatase (KDO 8-P phosphatase)
MPLRTFPKIAFKALDPEIEKKLKKIKLFIVDVDGVLTNGIIYYAGAEIGFNRFFHTHDGYILKELQAAGIKTAVISGGNSLGLKKRVELLNIDYVYLGDEDKRHAYAKIMAVCGLADEEVLYMGDEFFDIPLLKRVGFSATVPNASVEVQAFCDYVTERSGGEGAVREVADMLRSAQGIFPKVIDFDGTEIIFKR